MWGVPVDHEMFKNINDAQMLWYFYHFLEDRKERFEHNRDMVEYNASFIEPEAVRKIREAREESVKVPDKEFTAGIEYMFGKKINLPNTPQKGTVSSVLDPQAAAKMSDAYKKGLLEDQNKKLPNEAKYWTNFNLE